MDYLVLEGYQAAAEEFSKEANVSPPVDFSSIETRMTIREAVQRGDVEEAIELVNDLNPEVRNSLPSITPPSRSIERGTSTGHRLCSSFPTAIQSWAHVRH